MSSTIININIVKNITENINIINNIIYPKEIIEEMNEYIYGFNSPSINSPPPLHGISIFNKNII